MIPGVATVHRREDWQDPRYPVFGPSDDFRDNDTAVIHYTAADFIPADIAHYHRSMQYSYVTQRGYSLGYSWSVTQTGEVFQIRGWEFQSAANRDHNDHTIPILMLVDGQDAATDAALDSARRIIAEAERKAGRSFAIVGHGQLSGAATSCPGVGLRAQVAAGLFSPSLIPKPKPPTEGDEDDMAYLAIPPKERAGKPWLYVSTGVRPATTFDINDGVEQRRMDTIPAQYRAQQYDDLHRAAGLG